MWYLKRSLITRRSNLSDSDEFGDKSEPKQFSEPDEESTLKVEFVLKLCVCWPCEETLDCTDVQPYEYKRTAPWVWSIFISILIKWTFPAVAYNRITLLMLNIWEYLSSGIDKQYNLYHISQSEQTNVLWKKLNQYKTNISLECKCGKSNC